MIDFESNNVCANRFACHGTLLTIYRDMRKPSEVGGLFNQIYLTGYLLKVIVGVTGK